MTDPRYMRKGLEFAMGKLIEECGELQSALGKTMRWGWYSTNPELPVEEQERNMDWVLREMADVEDAIENLKNEMAHHQLAWIRDKPNEWHAHKNHEADKLLNKERDRANRAERALSDLLRVCDAAQIEAPSVDRARTIMKETDE